MGVHALGDVCRLRDARMWGSDGGALIAMRPWRVGCVHPGCAGSDRTPRGWGEGLRRVVAALEVCRAKCFDGVVGAIASAAMCVCSWWRLLCYTGRPRL
eukprot:7026559-Prymnesium_polylepis.2